MTKSVEYYLSKGFDQAAAEYFASGKRTIIAVTPNDDFTLSLTFDNGEKRLYNLAPSVRTDNIFAPLADFAFFKTVYLDEYHCVCWDIDPNVDSNIVWNNKIDLDPDTCYIDSTPIN